MGWSADYDRMQGYMDYGEGDSYFSSNGGSKIIDIAEIKRETEKAWLIVTLQSKEIWLPKSQCKIRNLKLTIPYWLYSEKNKLL